MESITLIFPDTNLLSEFIIDNEISNADVSSCELRLTASLSPELIRIALQSYNAKVYQKDNFGG